MRTICSVLFLCVICCQANDFYAAKGNKVYDHLTPVAPVLSSYDQRIADHLFVTDGRFGRFIVRPSFGPETCVSVHAVSSKELEREYGGWWAVPDDKKKYFITVTRASESLWYSMKGMNGWWWSKKVDVSRMDRSISLDLAVATQRAWARMLQRTKYPLSSSRGLDGVTYQFSVWVRGLGDLHGEAWSPNKGLVSEIAKLGHSLADLVSSRNASEAPLIKRLRDFEKRVPRE